MGPRPLLIEDCSIMAGKNRVGGTWDPVLLRYEEPQRDPRESLLHKYNPLSRSLFWYLKLNFVVYFMTIHFVQLDRPFDF